MKKISIFKSSVAGRMLGVAALLSLGLAGSALAQNSAANLPDRTVTIVLGYPAGGATDRVTRLAAKALSEQTGQSFIVENRAGANSNIGAEYVSRTKPDGYTLYVGTIANAINRTLYTKLNYDILEDFTPIGLLASVPNVLVINPKLPINSVPEYIAYARTNPGKLTCASAGSGSSIHLSCELFKIKTNTNILHVPYKGSGPAVADLMGGQVDSMFDNLPSALPHIKSGKLRALGVTSPDRVVIAKELPTLSQAGLPDFAVMSWFGLFARAGTPKPIVDKLNAELNRALNDPAMRETFIEAGFVSPTPPNSPQQFDAFTQGEIARWRKVINTTGIKVD
jgi:tripartite-type tricarboxylate transporter receptor subunit TctC